jgi:preprotein translocase SecE subunit
MARETRRQRRDARRSAGEVAQPQRDRARPALRAPAEPLPAEAGGDAGQRVPPRRGTFVRESWGELQKVEWPNRAQVIQGTVVVLIACAIVGAYLYGADQVLRRLVQNFFI